MTFAEGLLLGLIGNLITVLGFMIAWLVYKKNEKRKKEIEELKNIKKPYDFK